MICLLALRFRQTICLYISDPLHNIAMYTYTYINNSTGNKSSLTPSAAFQIYSMTGIDSQPAYQNTITLSLCTRNSHVNKLRRTLDISQNAHSAASSHAAASVIQRPAEADGGSVRPGQGPALTQSRRGGRP